ncbi:alpha/beta-hydrolase [Atractiella rhizophila]|nr:alpha/beta-hydrolase [Atractiella rhizophila]
MATETLIQLSSPPLSISGLPADEGVLKWLGIPFATAGRWERPVPLTENSWEGVWACDDFGPVPPQGLPPRNPQNYFGYGGDPAVWIKNMSEDCLNLNIFKPDVKEEGLPVMVYIYGGGFERGSSRHPQYDPSELVRTSIAVGKPTIQVTFNYRLNIFGFFALPDLEKVDKDGLTGNYGLYDQISALEWIQTNISRFGGDPANVTVFGESAGGISIAAHLTRNNPTSHLFTRAIMLSGCWGIGPFEQVREKDLSVVGIGEECATPEERVKKLRELPFQELLEKKEAIYGPNTRQFPYWPVAESSPKGLWTEDPQVALSHGKIDPQCHEYILSTCADDGAYLSRGLNTLTAHEKLLSFFPASIQTQVKETYGLPPADDALAQSTPLKDAPASKIMGDRFFGGLWFTARKLLTISNAYSGSKPKVYICSFEEPVKPKNGDTEGLGTTHAMDIAFFMGFKECWNGDWTSSEGRTSQEIQRRFLSFAKGGDPGDNWPALDPIFPFFEQQDRLLFEGEGKTRLQKLEEWEPKGRRMWSRWVEEGIFLHS